jgi:uncharacterized protein YgbK (DUF1537 family)
MGDLLLSFYGDDFTGSTDAMESLARGGVRTVLFTEPPTPAQLARYEGLQAFGVAGMTRAMPPEEMERTLRPVFAAMRQCKPPIVHYKVCSTFDSSPTIGSIGRAIDVGADVFGSSIVPVVVGAPSLGRYCVFGNLFARCGKESEPYRLDRHPSMSKHPTTPMDEADLRVHLAKQTRKSIGLIHVLWLEGDGGGVADAGAEVVLIDVLLERHLQVVGRLIDGSPFVVGSSGVESALMAHWGFEAKPFPAGEVRRADPRHLRKLFTGDGGADGMGCDPWLLERFIPRRGCGEPGHRGAAKRQQRDAQHARSKGGLRDRPTAWPYRAGSAGGDEDPQTACCRR